MDENSNRNSYNLDYFDTPQREPRERNSAPKNNKTPNKNNRKRKGLKWLLLDLIHNKVAIGITLSVAVLVAIVITTSAISKNTTPEVIQETTTVAPTTKATSHKISGVPVIAQDDLTACCESYSCTMLLQYLGFDMDIYEFVYNYLTIKPVYYGDDGTMYGPDMNSAFAGDIYNGYGINAPGMAKCMNNYFQTNKSNLRAYAMQNVPVEQLCEEYIDNDIPVMIWSTANMDEPFVHASWVVDYVDENATTKIGDTVSWQMHEHCMVLIGYDDKYYYLNDSVANDVSIFDRATFEDRYAKIGSQAIVVK